METEFVENAEQNQRLVSLLPVKNERDISGKYRGKINERFLAGGETERILQLFIRECRRTDGFRPFLTAFGLFTLLRIVRRGTTRTSLVRTSHYTCIHQRLRRAFARANERA